MSVCVVALIAVAQFAQTNTGELVLTVVDPAGLGVQATVELTNEAHQFRATFETNPQGVLLARRLAFGTYQIAVQTTGFARFDGVVDVRSVVPVEYRVTLMISPVQAQVTVAPSTTLLDPAETATVNHIGARTLQERLTALPGRALPDLVNTQPGWLLEANGILHPRGSEYQTQYVVDGLPLTDNRSPAFAPELDADDVQAMRVLTGGYPAEYGRKLGGVIEVVTAGAPRRGLHGAAAISAGSFKTFGVSSRGGYAGDRFAISMSGTASTTDRYLDPPVEDNFSNHGTTSSFAVRIEQDATPSDRVAAAVRRGRGAFLVPNERLQEEAGQRQDRTSVETAAQVSYQRVLSGSVVADLRGFARKVTADLWSNAAATPIDASQQRGFREVYFKGALAGHHGVHEWKAGADVVSGQLREEFAYRITDVERFDEETARSFHFADRAKDDELALFAQDQVRAGAWTISGGVRWDRYRLLVAADALSPRLALAWARPAAHFVARASYDRVFQTPAFENLLLASSPELDAVRIDSVVLRLPVRPSRGHFFEAGFTKGLFGQARLDVSHYRRVATHLADDDVLLNTGVSFPITLREGEIAGTELKLEIPRWRSVSASIAYGYMRGFSELPITGGLFLEEDAAALLASTGRVPISQDQRHTLRAQVTGRFGDRAWAGLAAVYNSGLPVESSDDLDDAEAQFGSRILDRVDFVAGRVKPSWSLDGVVGLALRRGGVDARIQLDARNLTDRLNVINFAGLFSGTALAPPRSIAVRVATSF